MKRVRFAVVMALILLAVHALPTDAKGATGGGFRGGAAGFRGGGTGTAGGGFHGGGAGWARGGGFHGGATGWGGGFHGGNPAWKGGFHGGTAAWHGNTQVFIGGGGWWGWPGWWGPGWLGPGWYGYPYYGYPYPYNSTPPAVIQQPPTEYIQPEPTPPQQAYWYYCQSARAYYPYVKECPGGWMQVVPQAPPSTQ